MSVLMGDGCEVSPEASLEDVVLGDRVVVRPGVQLKNVRVGSGAQIGRQVTLYSNDSARPVLVGQRAWLSYGVFGEATGGEIRIGDFAVLAHRSTLLTSSGPGEQSPLMNALYPVVLGGVHIGPHCWIGAHCVILPGADLTEGVVVGAGSLVREGRYREWCVYGGAPARLLRELDRAAVEHARRTLESNGTHPQASPPRESARTARLAGRLPLVIALGLIAFLIGTGRLDLRLLAGVRFDAPFVALLVLTGLALLATSLRWLCVVRAWGVKAGAADLFRVALYSNVFTFVSPAGTGTDVARAIHLKRAGGSSWTHTGTVALADRLIGLQTLLAVGAIACWVSAAQGIALVVTALACLSIAAPFLAISFAERLPLSGKWANLPAVARPASVRWLAVAYGWSVAAALLNGLLPLVGVAAIAPTTPGVSAIGAGFMVVVINSVAPTPGGLGIGEAAAAQLVSGEAGAAGLLLVRWIAVAWALVFGGAAFLRTPVGVSPLGPAAPAAVPDGDGIRR